MNPWGFHLLGLTYVTSFIIVSLSIREYLITTCKINNPSERFHVTQHIALLGYVISFLSKVRMYISDVQCRRYEYISWYKCLWYKIICYRYKLRLHHFIQVIYNVTVLPYSKVEGLYGYCFWRIWIVKWSLMYML